MKIEVISPFPPQALPRVWRWMETFRDRVSDDFSPKTLEEFVEAMLTAWQNQKAWAVYGDGELGGLITFQRLSPWLGTAHCVFKPDFQGKGIAPRACRIAIAEMFAEGVGKLAFYPLAGNLAIGSLLVALGAKREGCLREHTVCQGKPANINVYGLSKGGFEYACRNSGSDADCERDRGRGVDCGLGAGQPQKDPDLEDHADVGPSQPGPA